MAIPLPPNLVELNTTHQRATTREEAVVRWAKDWYSAHRVIPVFLTLHESPKAKLLYSMESVFVSSWMVFVTLTPSDCPRRPPLLLVR